MLSKDLDCLVFGPKGIFYMLGVYVIKSSANNEIICVSVNKHHTIFRRYSDHPWKIMCWGGLSKHGYGKMPPK